MHQVPAPVTKCPHGILKGCLQSSLEGFKGTEHSLKEVLTPSTGHLSSPKEVDSFYLGCLLGSVIIYCAKGSSESHYPSLQECYNYSLVIVGLSSYSELCLKR